MYRSFCIAIVMLGALVAATLPASADDWVAKRLRGVVMQLVDGEWQKLSRNDVVPDNRDIRTLLSGHVTLQRGNETVEVGPMSQIRIFDRGGETPFTTVQEKYGTVMVEADVKNVQHFAVESPFLAAVVKGTKFIVASGDAGASVTVLRGVVAVEDMLQHNHVDVVAGQTAWVSVPTDSSQLALRVTGKGKLPQILDQNGNPAMPGPLAMLGGTVGGVVSAAGSTVGEVAGAAAGAVGTTTATVLTTVTTTVDTTESIVGGVLHGLGGLLH